MDVLRRVIESYDEQRRANPINVFTAGEVDLMSDYHSLLKSMGKLQKFLHDSTDAGEGEVDICLPGEGLHESKLVIYMSKNTKPTNRLLKQANVELNPGHYKLGEDVKQRIKEIGVAQKQDKVKCLIVPVFYTDGDDFYILGLVFDCYDAIVLESSDKSMRRVYFVHSTSHTTEAAQYEGFRNYLVSSEEMSKYGFVLYDSYCNQDTLMESSNPNQSRLENFQASLFQFYNFALHPGDAVTYVKGGDPEYSINNTRFWQETISDAELEQMKKALGTLEPVSEDSKDDRSVTKDASRITKNKSYANHKKESDKKPVHAKKHRPRSHSKHNSKH